MKKLVDIVDDPWIPLSWIGWSDTGRQLNLIKMWQGLAQSFEGNRDGRLG